MVHRLGSITLIRANPIRGQLRGAVLASAMLAGSLALAGCYADDTYQLPAKAMKELSPEMLTLLDKKNMPKESPILVRIFKEESELEVWKEDTTGRYELLKVYPICRWSGELGPKVREGDRQAPEGFYAITPNLMNPNSSYYLAINIGFPNAFDKANGRSGAFLMIHGDCSSRGCYAMTDEEIGEIYSLAREALLGGQQSFQIQAYPFRMTAANMARHRNNPNIAFWRMIKEGNDHFEVSRQEPKVDVCERHYVFDAQPPGDSTKPLVFDPSGRCPAFAVPREIAAPALEKQRNDDAQTAQLTRFNVPVAPVKTGTDGGTNRVFQAQLEKSTRTVDSQGHLHVVLASSGDTADKSPTIATQLFGGLFGTKPPAQPPQPAQPTQVAAAETGSQERGGFFGNLFSSKGESPAQANATGSVRGSESASATAAQQKAKPAAHTEIASAAGLRLKPKTEPAKTDTAKTEPARNEAKPQEASAPRPAKAQQEANAAAPPANSGGMLNGAQPVVPTGTFNSRWGGLQ